MKTLIPMVEFVLEVLNQDPPYDEVAMLTKLSNYANFLSQPLELGMFVPCDEYGNVLQEPKWENVDKNALEGVDGKYYSMLHDFQKAKEKVLFEGFYLRKEKGITWLGKEGFEIQIPLIEIKVEILANEDIKLTDSAIKQLGL